MRRRALITVIGLIALTVSATTAAGQDCPTSKTAGQGFVVERGSNLKNEIFHDGPTVRTILRQGDHALLETTQYEGLFDLDRLDRGRRTTLKPKSNLAKLFPLKVGQKIVADFELVAAGASATNRTVVLKVLADDELYIGKCKYKVLKIENSVSQGDNTRPVFYNFEYYSPELKLVIAREFKERDGKTTINKYDKIYLRGE